GGRTAADVVRLAAAIAITMTATKRRTRLTFISRLSPKLAECLSNRALSSTLSHRRNPARNYCAAHTRDGGGNRISTPARMPRWGPRFWRDLSVIPAGLLISADLRRFLALSKRFPD